MGRLVAPALISSSERLLKLSSSSVHDLNAAIPLEAKPASAVGDDNYAERIAKYVPAEVIAFFLAADKMFPDPNAPALATCGANFTLDCFISSHSLAVALTVFLIGLVSTPLYIWKQSSDGVWGVHSVMASIAFVVWAYAIHAHVFINSIFSSALSGFLVLLYSLISGFVVPVKDQIK